jgi:signal transduction histidine kinase
MGRFEALSSRLLDGDRWSRGQVLVLVLAAAALLHALLGLSGLGDSQPAAEATRIVYDAAMVGGAMLCGARAVLVSRERLAWGFIAVGLALGAVGDVYFTLAVAQRGDAADASAVDAFFVAKYPCLAVGMAALARTRLRGRTKLVLLDGVTAALATTSVALAVLAGPAVELMQASGAFSIATVASPLGDFVLLGFVAAVIAVADRAGRSWSLLAAALGASGIADTVWLYVTAAGGHGTWFDFLWPLSALCFAAAAWQRAEHTPVAPVHTARLFALPSFLAVAALGVLVFDHFERLSLASVAVASITILLVILRVGIAVRDLGRFHEERLRLSQRAAQSEQLEALGQLAGGIAHDFNNLLAVIVNYSEFVLDSLAVDDPRREDVQQIRRSAECAAQLTRQLLVFSRRDVSAPQHVDVNAVLGETVALLRSTLSERTALEVVAVPDLPPVQLGAGELDQILLNVVVNARDAMPAGGQVHVQAERVALARSSPELRLPAGCFVRLTVRDSGVGMSEGVVKHAFEPFFSTKAVGQGTGLGLATVYGIVQRAGGAVALRSAPGDGTTVTIHLPAAGAAPAADGAAHAAPSLHRGGSERILLVEDEHEVRRSTRRILAANGYDVREAPDGRGALLLAGQEPRIDLLVTDVVMPNVSGPALAARLRLRWPGLPVVFMSGYPGDVVSQQGLDERAGPLLLKPVTAAELVHQVRRALDA